jgi:hypothetical protein
MNAHAPAKSTPSLESRLDRLAEVAVKVGLGLAPGQELVMTAPLDAVPLARQSPSRPIGPEPPCHDPLTRTTKRPSPASAMRRPKASTGPTVG